MTIQEGISPIYPLSRHMNEKTYAVSKIHVWLSLIKQGKKPLHWNTPTYEGTDVEFDFINHQEDAEESLQELQFYIKKVNNSFNLNIHLDVSVTIKESI
ncbi:hypothetical protein [Halobacillus litoralis]|nr:hypothetical protein [Halobacillus litoralis]